jgi:hypothetical protein
MGPIYLNGHFQHGYSLQTGFRCMVKNIHHKIIITFDLLNTTFMTWHEGHLSLIASSKIC